MGGLTGYLFPQPIRDSVFSTERGLEYLSKGHNSTRDKKRRSMVDPPLLPDVLRERELASRLNLSFIGRHSWADMRQFVSMLREQGVPRTSGAKRKARGILRFLGEKSFDCTRSYAQILIGSRLFLTAMAIHLSLRVAPLDLQQGGNSRIPYVHVPAARMSILVYIATAINTFFFLLTKHPLFSSLFRNRYRNGCFFYVVYLSYWGFRGRPMWGTFWVWDARLTSVFISFLIYLGALCFQKLPVEPAPISIRAGPIDIPIIKSSVNWWNTSHQPGSISRSGSGKCLLQAFSKQACCKQGILFTLDKPGSRVRKRLRGVAVVDVVNVASPAGDELCKPVVLSNELSAKPSFQDRTPILSSSLYLQTSATSLTKTPNMREKEADCVRPRQLIGRTHILSQAYSQVLAPFRGLWCRVARRGALGTTNKITIISD
ncbi:putative cytochrome c biosynthesis ccmC-like mitochondrial protein [Sesamum alatum]|uniref:Cytochrome c biosynthesis ccmC-like mitochondrial protein n=1 Tax=Sesamum alatum TaxID=300844 RepID=A0AAE2C9H0_9LAMI|nr:putative cytochrome c biosynthesis ccmC-like mitochondrial protein [Sesamum alatum]